jgi:hypothetical protein
MDSSDIHYFNITEAGLGTPMIDLSPNVSAPD